MSQFVKKYLVDWNHDGDFGDAEDDITADVMPWNTFRGREGGSQLTAKSLAGTLTILLNNESDKYSRYNAGSPIFGNILPGRLVAIQTNDSFPYTFPIIFPGTPIWTGYLEDIVPIVSETGRKTAVLTAIGSFAMVQKKVSVAMQTTILTSDAIIATLDALAWSATRRAIETGQTTMERWWTDFKNGLNVLREIEDTEFGFLWEKANADIAFADRRFRFTNPRSITAVATFSDDPTDTDLYSRIEQKGPIQDIFDIIEATVQRYTVESEATLWALSESGANSPFIVDGDTRNFWASYPTPDSASDAWGVDAWRDPLVENTDYEANTKADGSGVDKSGILSIALTPFGNRMKIAVTPTGSDVYLTLLQARGTPITRLDPVTVSDQDDAAILLYGERTFPIPAKFIPNTTEARSYVAYVKGIYSGPIPMLRIAMVANVSQASMAVAVGVDINERVNIVAANKTGLGITQPFIVEAVRHVIGEDKVHWVILDVTSVESFSGAWIVGTTSAGDEMELLY